MFGIGNVKLVLDDSDASSELLIALAAAEVLGMPASDLEVRHHCRNCGSSEHGQPIVDGCSVSFSRSGDRAIAAARVGPPIGVDIESVRRVSAHPVDAALLHPGERATLPRLEGADVDRYLAALWVAKEAVTKSTGDGLRVDLAQLELRVEGTTATVVSGPDATVTLFEVADDIIGALATQR